MSRHLKHTEAFIINDRHHKVNIGKKVRLLRWLGPNEVFSYVADLKFHAGDKGAWIVTPVFSKTLVCKAPNGLSFISNVALYQEDHLDETMPKSRALDESDLLDETTLTEVILDPEAFDRFEQFLVENPLSKNETLKTLLSRPKPWS